MKTFYRCLQIISDHLILHQMRIEESHRDNERFSPYPRCNPVHFLINGGLTHLGGPRVSITVKFGLSDGSQLVQVCTGPAVAGPAALLAVQPGRLGGDGLGPGPLRLQPLPRLLPLRHFRLPIVVILLPPAGVVLGPVPHRGEAALPPLPAPLPPSLSTSLSTLHTIRWFLALLS